MRACRRCGQPLHQLCASRRRAHNWICTPCANRDRDTDAERYVARKLTEHLRHQGRPPPYPGVQFVRQVMRESGKSDLRGWSIVFAKESALTVANARVVRCRISRRAVLMAHHPVVEEEQ